MRYFVCLVLLALAGCATPPKQELKAQLTVAKVDLGKPQMSGEGAATVTYSMSW
jgi:hypothetical protein